LAFHGNHNMANVLNQGKDQLEKNYLEPDRGHVAPIEAGN